MQDSYLVPRTGSPGGHIWGVSDPMTTCRVLIAAPNGSSVEVRALLDSASSASFVSEHLTQSLGLPLCIRMFVC